LALVAPQISFNSQSFILSGTGGGSNTTHINTDNVSYSETVSYGYEISKKNPDNSLTMITRVWTDATSFTKDLTALLSEPCNIVVKQFENINGSSDDNPSGWNTYTYSAESNPITVETIIPYIPNAIYDLVSDELRITEAYGNVSKLRIYKALNTDSNYTLAKEIVTTAESYTEINLSTLLGIGIWQVMVRAVNEIGQPSNDSEIVNVTVSESSEAGSLAVTEFSVTLTPNIAEAVINGVEPNLTATKNVILFPGLAEADVEGYTPGVTLNVVLTPNIAEAIAEASTPNIVAVKNVVMFPPVAEAVAHVLIPAVNGQLIVVIPIKTIIGRLRTKDKLKGVLRC
jgi:hypothetical protein